MAFVLISVVVATAFLAFAEATVPMCDKNNPDFSKSPYCLPNDYNKDIVPETEGPLHVNVDIFVFEVSRIDDIALTMTFELYFDLTWNESRFLINDSSPEWTVDGTVMGSTNFVKDLWLPDIQILNLKQFQKRQIVTDVAGLIIFRNKSVLYTVSTEAIISCPMKFSAYPLDHQECKFHVGSYIHDATQISFTGTFGHDVANQRAQQYQINITALDEEDKTVMWANREYSQTGFKINLIRRRTPVLLQVYLPSGLFVLVSWISFIVPPEIVPGRMALLVTLFLVLVNIFNSVTANAPKSEGLTAVETWVVMCILHVFCVLAEYAIILKIIQVEKRKNSARLRKLDRINNGNLSASNVSLNHRSFTNLSSIDILENSINSGNGDGNSLTFLEKLNLCFNSSKCCVNSSCHHRGGGGAHRSSINGGGGGHAHSTHCGCDDHAHHNRGSSSHRAKVLQQRVKGGNTSPPTPPLEQVFEADPQYAAALKGGVATGSIGPRPTATQTMGVVAPHHPLLSGYDHDSAGCSLPRHRHVHRHGHAHSSYQGGGTTYSHAHSQTTQTSLGGGASSNDCGRGRSHTHSHQLSHPLNAFGGSGQDIATPTSNENEASWTKIDLNRSGLNTGSSPTSQRQHDPGAAAARSEHLKTTAKYERIDRIAMWLFPIIFFLFNVCYWSYYLLLEDALQDLWNCGGFGSCEAVTKKCDHYAYACDDQ